MSRVVDVNEYTIYDKYTYLSDHVPISIEILSIQDVSG
jgi:hypothetical protein